MRVHPTPALHCRSMTQPATSDERHQQARDRAITRVILIEGAINFVVLVAKFVVGVTTGSLAILAEAVHSLGDVANNFVAFFVMGSPLGIQARGPGPAIRPTPSPSGCTRARTYLARPIPASQPACVSGYPVG